MFVLGFIIAASYWPGWISPAVSPRFAALSIVAPALLLWRKEAIPVTWAHLAGCALILWSALTLLWTPQPLDSIDALWQTLCLPAVCFCLGSQAPSRLRPLFAGAAIGLALSSVVATIQWLGFPILPDTVSPGGLFTNRNYMAEAAALVLVAVVAERMWWTVPLLLPAAVLPAARGALLAVGAALGVHYRRYVVTILALACLLFVLYLESIHYAQVGISDRFAIWINAAGQLTWLGHGIGSFWALHAGELYRGTVPTHAHNDFLELASDLGIIGAALFAWFVWELRGQLDTARLVLIALAVEMCFGFPTHLPATLTLGAVCAGYAVRYRPVLRRQPYLGRNLIQERLA